MIEPTTPAREPGDRGDGPRHTLNVEQMLALTAHLAPPPPPRGAALLDKLGPEHMDRLLQNFEADHRRENTREILKLCLVAGFGVAALALVLGLCWMFLAYNKPELLEKIVALIIGLASGGLGGFGVGRATAGKKDED